MGAREEGRVKSTLEIPCALCCNDGCIISHLIKPRLTTFQPQRHKAHKERTETNQQLEKQPIMPFDLKAGIVRILAADGTTTSGTGFILSEKGIIATCSHVIQAEKLQVRGYPKPEKVEVIFRANGQRGAARLLPQAWRAAEAEDVALLQLEGPLPPEVVPLSIGSSEGSAGHAFQTFGFPDQSPEEGIYGEGRLLDQTTILGIRVLQVKSSEITPGFSGAPVFDTESRRVVGMVTSIAAPDKFGRLAETAFITPAETLISIYPELVPSDVRPYMGLSPFTEKDAEFFFGRRRLVEGLEEALRARPRFLLVMGPSGSGKSSVVQAGLMPRLRKGSVPGSDRWGIMVARPADRPFDMLERAGLRGAYASFTDAARGWLDEEPRPGEAASHPGSVRGVFGHLSAGASPQVLVRLSRISWIRILRFAFSP